MAKPIPSLAEIRREAKLVFGDEVDVSIQPCVWDPDSWSSVVANGSVLIAIDCLSLDDVKKCVFAAVCALRPTNDV